MDKSVFTDTLDTVKERLSSPVFGTFIFSFLITNWKIPVGAFLPISQIKELGYKSYFDLFEKNANFFWPTCFTLFYILGFPWIKNFLIAWSNLSENASDSWWLHRAKKTAIPFDKYFILRQTHDKNLEELKSIISKESETLAENSQLKSEKFDWQNERNDLKKELTYIRQLNDNFFFNGAWEISNFLNLNENITYSIRNNNIARVDKLGESISVGKIEEIAYNLITRSLLLVIKEKNTSEVFLYSLQLNDTNEFSGRPVTKEVNDPNKNLRFKRI